MKFYPLLIISVIVCCTPETQPEPAADLNVVLLSGEITSNSVILQGRFVSSDTLVGYDIPGIEGQGQFQVSTDPVFTKYYQATWRYADPQRDYILREKIDGLTANAQYFYRIKGLINNSLDTTYSSIGSFKTLPDSEINSPVSFTISTGFNYEKFYGSDKPSEGYMPATGLDHTLGFEAFESVKKLQPDFFIANGDVVYYDKPQNEPELWAKDLSSMRAKWHRYFAMPRNRALCLTTPVYYLKDDHDYRFNDCDTTNVKFSDPSHRLGVHVFREQLPVVLDDDPGAKTYRTIRAGKLMQLWLVEGRDYRSPNQMEDTPEKTIWGEAQKTWLKESLLASDAIFKLLISPTPMIGPDDAYKKDNHANVGGFQSEGQEIFSWLIDQKFLEKNFYLICGDRHWQYHSIHPNGLEEFSSGAFVNQNSRPGRRPGDPESTDPNASISSPFMQLEQFGGGFLQVSAENRENGAALTFTFFDTQGSKRYEVSKLAR